MSHSAPHPVLPWQQVRVRTRHANTTYVEFRFDPKYVRALWARHPQSTLRTRSAASPDAETLLLNDSIEIQETKVYVRAWLVPSAQPEVYHLRVEIVAPQRIKRNVRVILYWEGAEYAAPLRAGEMFFEDISPPDFSRHHNNLPSRRLRLRFEFEHAGSNGSNGKH